MKISELPKATAATDEDIAVIVQDGETRKISRKTFLGRVPDDLALQDGTLQLTENGETVGIGVQLPAEPSEETKTYADNAAEQAETHAKESAQQYASDAQSAAEKAAKSYTDAAIQTADTAAQGYATTAQDNAIQQAAALAQEAQSAAETAAQQYATAAQQAAEATAQEYADAAEAAAKAADPTDLLLTDRLLQLGVGGTAIGEGVQIPDTGEKFELICDETLQEAVNSITITQTPDGSALNIKKLFIAASITTVNENGLVMLNFNGGNMYLMYRNFDTDANTTKTIWCYVEKIAPGVFRSVYPTTMLTATSLDSIQGLGTANRELSGAICCFGQNPANYFAKATRVTFGATSDLYSLKSGSRVMMWAVMDKDE